MATAKSSQYVPDASSVMAWVPYVLGRGLGFLEHPGCYDALLRQREARCCQNQQLLALLLPLLEARSLNAFCRVRGCRRV